MEIPDWYVWIALGLAVLQALDLVDAIRRLRAPDHVARSKARLELLEAVGKLLTVAGLLLGAEVAESWFWLALAGFVLITAVYAVKGVHRLRARHPSP